MIEQSLEKAPSKDLAKQESLSSIALAGSSKIMEVEASKAARRAL
jgi:hypothetical protein